MIINKVINNNIVSVVENDSEKIVMGRGLGFNKKPGDSISEDKIEKIFVMNNENHSHKFKELIVDIPLEHMLLGDEIISYAKQNLGKKLSDLLYISLIDHIYTSIERSKINIFIKNDLIWDIKRFYPDEYKIGEFAIKLIKERFDVELPVDEAGFIALHLVNASQEGGNFKDVVEESNIMHDITNIVKYEFNKEFDEDSVYYYRFITHLKFFAKRVVLGNTYNDGVEDELLELIKVKYRNSYNCVKNIGAFLKNTYNYEISKEEELYLTIHIERVIYKA
ncbi:MAG: PRD domain-containing protein [Helcococcus sp.]|nr:PRD domain-containing protein [Helcococcus sp.]